ncbi:hypothetical protein [Maridesulfovibrio sp.]|uniref:hypothetical protein n=1 Tax=Maridesulfovibrio sp. TaxID=2795000 RepID=UPI0029C9D19F|nr:hypothetical protein [Maridesulfovibrio sp.]
MRLQSRARYYSCFPVSLSSVAGVFLFFFLVLLLSGCDSGEQETPPPPRTAIQLPEDSGLTSAAKSGPPVFYQYTIFPGSPPKMLVEFSVTELKPGIDYIVVPTQFGTAHNIQKYFKNIRAFDSQNKKVAVVPDRSHSPRLLGLAMAAWKISVPQDGFIKVKAELVEPAAKELGYGWILQNHLRDDWVQFAATSSRISLESVLKSRRVERFDFKLPQGTRIVCSEKKQEDGYAYDLWTMAFIGDYKKVQSFSDDFVSVEAYANPPGLKLKEIIGKSTKEIAGILRHAIKIYGGPPDPASGLPLKVRTVYQTDSAFSRPRFKAGVACNKDFFFAFTNTEGGLTDYVTHESLHFYNEWAFSGQPIPPSGTPADVMWVLEGFNEYVTFKWQYDAGMISAESFWKHMRDKKKAYMASKWKNTHSIRSAADHYNSQEAFDIIYAKGPLVALLLDQSIKEQTNNSKSIDDVFVQLYRNYNRYQGRRLYTNKDVLNILTDITGADYSNLYKKWVLGTESLDFSSVPQLGG